VNEKPTLEIPFALGEEVWTPSYDHAETWIECPECAGTKALMLIKGNGEQQSLDCNYCQSGYDPPRGRVTRTDYRSVPQRFICRRVVGFDGTDINYSESNPEATCYTYRSSKDLFRNELDCAERCDVLNVECALNDKKRAIANLESKRGKLAHSSHYWSRKVADLKRDLIAAEARLAVCKAKPKGEKA
jgi:hypothetical protein